MHHVEGGMNGQPLDESRPPIRVTIRYSGQLRNVFGTPAETCTLTAGSTAQELVLKRSFEAGANASGHLIDHAGQQRNSTLLFVNNEQADWSKPVLLQDGDEIILLAPFAGG